jgi:two-component system response regulator PilR (NtrC family)
MITQKIEKSMLGQMVIQPSILLVEDEKGVRELMAMALSDMYRTYQAANGREAMEIIYSNNDIDVVVSDFNMPEVNGLELLEKMRTEKINMPFIFVTANTHSESKSYASEMGAFDYMTKPFELEQLKTIIQNAIESQSASYCKPLNKGDVS